MRHQLGSFSRGGSGELIKRHLWPLAAAIAIAATAALGGSWGVAQGQTIGGTFYGSTPYMVFYGTVTLDGAPAPIGTVIQAYNTRGVLAGMYTVNSVSGAGYYGYMKVYQADPNAYPPIDGMSLNEQIIFKVNGNSVTSPSSVLFTSPSSSDPPSPTIVNLVAGTLPNLTLDGQVALLKRGAAGELRIPKGSSVSLSGLYRWETDLFRTASGVTTGGVTVYQAGTNVVVGRYSATTDGYGRFSATITGIPAGTYDVSVKGANTLSNKKSNVVLPSASRVDFGSLIPVDTNGTDTINGGDRSYILPALPSVYGDVANPADPSSRTYLPYADVNADDSISGADVSIIVAGGWFNWAGPQIVAAALYRLMSLEIASVSDGITPELERPQIYLSASSHAVDAGDIFTVDIDVDTADMPADTIDAYLAYDPALLEVVDATGQPAAAIEVNEAAFKAGDLNCNQVDSVVGRVDFSATLSSFGRSFPEGPFTAATVRFKAKTAAASADVALIREGARWTDIYLAGQSIWPAVSGGSVAIAGQQ